MKKRAVIFAPFWDQPPHVGIFRTSRYISWFREKGFDVLIVRAGKEDLIEVDEEGNSILHVTDEILKFANIFTKVSRLLKLRLIILIFNKITDYFAIPDRYILWAKRITKIDKIQQYFSDASVFLSTSPPNSAHIPPHYLSKKLNVPHIVDMRDGWLDEPLREYLNEENFKKRKEEKQERNILENAAHIIVTSDNWKSNLNRRLNFTKEKTTVITNAYPLNTIDTLYESKGDRDSVKLFYGGNFRGNSRISRLEAVFEAFHQMQAPGKKKLCLDIYGEIGFSDHKVIEKFKPLLEEKGKTFSFYKPVSRDFMLNKCLESDGLLLPSISNAAIPSKTFEYIILKKPVLVITMPESSVWKMADELPQFFRFPVLSENDEKDELQIFLKVCLDKKIKYSVPEKYSEKYLGEIFGDILDSLNMDDN